MNKTKRAYIKLYNMLIRGRFKSHKGEIIHPRQIAGSQYITIGNDSQILDDAILTTWKISETDPQLVIGDGVRIGEHIHISAANSVKIGNGVLTGRYVFISDNDHGNSSREQMDIPPYKRPIYSKGAIEIGNNVWIGERVTILGNVHNGDGSVIAANAVVTHDIPPYCIAGGVPAKILKQQ